MQMDLFLGDPNNLRMIPLRMHCFNLMLLVRRRLLHPKLSNNEVSTYESLPLDYAQDLCMYSRTLIQKKIFFEARTER